MPVSSDARPEPLPLSTEPLFPAISMLLCPGCGENGVGYVHPGPPMHNPNKSQAVSLIGTRGDYTEIPIWCEMCDDSFSLVIGFHEGHTFMGIVRNTINSDAWRELAAPPIERQP